MTMKPARQKFPWPGTFVLAVIVGILIRLLASPTAAAAAADAATETKLLFLANKNIAPVVYLKNDAPAGVAVDIVQALARHMPEPITIKAMDWPEAQALVAQGEADALIQINQTAERNKIYDFSDTLLESQFSIFTNTNRVGLSGIAALRGLRVGVEAGGLPGQVLARDPAILLTIIPNFLEGFKRLNETAIDAVVVDYRVGSYVIAEHGLRGIKVTGEPIAFSYSSLAVKKGNGKLLTAINTALQRIKADGTYQKIIDHWKPKEVVFYTREQLTERVYDIAIIILICLFLVAVAWTMTLRMELTKKRAAQAMLREQYSTLRSIIDGTNALIFSVDRQYRYTSFNQGHAALMKTLYGAEIEPGHGLLAYITVAEDRRAARSNLDRALAGEHHVHEEYTGEGPQSRQYLRISHSPIRTESGEIIGVVGLAQEMTARRQAEERLTESADRYRSLFEDSPISLWEEDFSLVKQHIDDLRASGVSDFRAYFAGHPQEVCRCAGAVRVIDVNRATLEMFKADSKEHLLSGLAGIFCDKSVAVFQEELITLAAGGTQFHSEAVQQTLTGERLDTVVQLSMAPGFEESWAKIFVSVSDRTERKRTEQHLALRSFALDNVREAAYLSDEQGGFVYVNAEACRALGYSRAEMLTMTVFDVVVDDPVADWHRHVCDLKAMGSLTRETRHKTKVGGILPVEINDSHFSYDSQGYILSFARDIAARKQVEEERLANLVFFECLDQVNRAIQGTSDLERMMSEVLNAILAAFACDRAYLLYPCDPEAPSWGCPMERTSPEYPGVSALGKEIPMDPGVAEKMRILLVASGPVKFGLETGIPLPMEVAQRFGIQSIMAMAIYPRTGTAWEFGMHQCSSPRVWSAAEERLFAEIGRRLADALTSLLMQRDLRDSESKLAEAQRLGHFGSWDRDFDAGTVTLSDEACRIFGLPPQEDRLLLDKWHEQWLQLIHPEDQAKVAQALTAALRGDLAYDVEYRVIRPDGEVRSIHSYAEVTKDDSGHPRRMFGTMQDITERQKAEATIRELNDALEQRVAERTAELQLKSEQLQGSRQALMNLVEDLNDKTVELEAARTEAEKANRAKSSFLANMSHELRTPLNAILGFAQLLERSAGLTGEERRNLAIIAHSGQHLLGLINDILDIAKIEAGQTPLTVAPFDLFRLVRDLGALFASRATAGGLYCRTELDPALPRYVIGDAGKIRQVLINLLGNALKFTQQGGVCLSVRPAPHDSGGAATTLSLQFEVADSGIGIAAEKLGVIFDPFIQANCSKDQHAGTGLGLTISRHFVQLMGGEIWVRSTVGQGATFAFAIPVSESQQSAIIEEQAPLRVKGIAPGQREYRILIVEDREENRLLMRQLLQGVGFTVREAVNGQEGVELFNSWQPDFVWMDIRMPVMDGFEATRRIKESAKGALTPVVALTASVFEEQRGNILAAGCDGFVRKPFRDEEIWGVMAKHLGVRFIYEEEPAAPLTAPTATPLAAATLDLLDRNLLTDLAHAALTCDRESCLALIGTIAPEQAATVQALQGLVSKHQFDKLYAMLEDRERLRSIGC